MNNYLTNVSISFKPVHIGIFFLRLITAKMSIKIRPYFTISQYTNVKSYYFLCNYLFKKPIHYQYPRLATSRSIMNFTQ